MKGQSVLAFTYPWYTYLGLAAVACFLLGCLWSLSTLLLRMTRFLFVGPWTVLSQRLVSLFSGPLSSYGTAHFATNGELKQAGVWNATGLPLAQTMAGRIMDPRAHLRRKLRFHCGRNRSSCSTTCVEQNG